MTSQQDIVPLHEVDISTTYGEEPVDDISGEEAKIDSSSSTEATMPRTPVLGSETTPLIPPRRRRRGRGNQRLPTEELYSDTSMNQPYTFSVSVMEPNGQKEPLASAPLEPQEGGGGSPCWRRRRNISYGELREAEGESIIKEDKKKRRRKRRAKKQQISDMQGDEDIHDTSASKEEEQASVIAIPALGEEEEEYLCSTARTALIMPFTWRSAFTFPRRHIMEWITQLRQRSFTDLNGRKVPLWVPKEKLPSEISDFTPQFRQVLGWRERERTSQTWSCQRLIINPEAIQILFSSARLVTIQNDTHVNYEVDIEGIELLAYPLGSASLVININWIPPRKRKDEKFSLDDARTVIFASKYRHKVKGLCLGWNFYDKSRSEKFEEILLNEDHAHDYGREMLEATYQPNKTVSLCTLGNWLLMSHGEDPGTPSRFLDHARHAYHHSTVVLKQPPPQEIVQEYLFHLRHAYGQKNRPPPFPQYHLGSVLVPRMNRYIGISREGTVCISWPVDVNDENDFELSKWHRKFQGVYLLLALHAHGERSVLYELSDLAAAQAENLMLTVSAEADFEHMKASRQKLRELAALMVRYTLSMSSDDCGGSSEYSEFFTTLRKVFGIPELRAEISQELKDVLAVVEANYLEEERRQRDEAEEARKKNREIQYRLQEHRDRQEQQFNLWLSILGTFTLPLMVVSSVFGMNLTDLPNDVEFWPLVGVTSAISVVMFFILIFWHHRVQTKTEAFAEQLSKSRQQLNAQRWKFSTETH